jgi:hypothetical protein
MSSHPLTLTPGPPLTPSSREYVQYRIQSNPLACEWNTCPLIPSLSHLAPLSLLPPENMYNIEHNPICWHVNETHVLSSLHSNTWPPFTPSSREYVQYRIQSNTLACELHTCPLILSLSHSPPLSPSNPQNICIQEYNPIRWRVIKISSTLEKAWHSVTIIKFFSNFLVLCSVNPPVKNKFYFPGYSIHIPG